MKKETLEIRPYQLVEIIAKTGDGADSDFGDEKLNKIMNAVRRRPSTPLTLRCKTSGTFAYQNNEELDCYTLLDRYRDLKVLQMLGLTPGDSRPALDLFIRLLENIKIGRDIIWFDEDTSTLWQGEPKSDSYEKGVAMGINKIIPNVRTKTERLKAKEISVKELFNQKVLLIRPHHLMCMACNYRGPEDLTPLEEDNIFEVIEIMQNNPDIPVKLIEGTTCVICTPCPELDPSINKCIGGGGMSLRDELKDLYVLRKLGLEYGDIMPAKELYTLLFEKIKHPSEICAFGEEQCHSREWRACGLMENGVYAKTRETGILRN